jgi:enterobactin synthetase component D
MADFQIAFHHATPHGVLCAVNIPDRPDPVPEEVLASLHAPERKLATELRMYRQVQYVGGRIAMRGALRQLGAPERPVLPDERGTPKLPVGFTGSISHKRDLAIAMVARDNGWTLGVDLEDYAPARPNIARAVLRDTELAAIEELPPERAWIELLVRFSIKESVYKAIDPYVRRYVDFKEAEVETSVDGRALVTLHLQRGEGPFEVDARFDWLDGRLLTSARIRPTPGQPG